jgi:hypothetical protein
MESMYGAGAVKGHLLPLNTPVIPWKTSKEDNRESSFEE